MQAVATISSRCGVARMWRRLKKFAARGNAEERDRSSVTAKICRKDSGSASRYCHCLKTVKAHCFYHTGQCITCGGKCKVLERHSLAASISLSSVVHNYIFSPYLRLINQAEGTFSTTLPVQISDSLQNIGLPTTHIDELSQIFGL